MSITKDQLYDLIKEQLSLMELDLGGDEGDDDGDDSSAKLKFKDHLIKIASQVERLQLSEKEVELVSSMFEMILRYANEQMGETNLERAREQLSRVLGIAIEED